jgi:4a-hydroxytetrahydrobiopterin dehydratase
MSQTDLTQERCLPCEGGLVHLLTRDDLEVLAPSLPAGWSVRADGKALERKVQFARDFPGAMAFVNRVADLAESEGHHPDFCVSGWTDVHLSLTTHALAGLSRNDLILAAKIEALL